jgi:hexokinase
MDHECIDMEETCNIFLQEMQRGLAGQRSSLAMLPTYIETGRRIPKSRLVIVMDAGGTNFRAATVFFGDDGKAVVENFKVYSMPGMKGEVSKSKFFGTMAGYIEQVVDKSRNIGFCFSYPIEMFPNKDGRVLYFSKEIQATEVVGAMIGESLNVAIGALGHKGSKQIVLLNDTVATLLAGRADPGGRIFDSHIGFILGTGTNTSYVESNSNITKAKDLDPGKSQIVNVESGGFGKAPRGAIDREFDESSRSPGVNVFEKMISGAYLGPLCLKTVHVAGEAGLFSKAAVGKFKRIKELSTKDINDFMYRPEGRGNPLSSAVAGLSQDDAATVYYVVDGLIERAAKLTAVNLSSAAIKCGKGRNPCRPVCIVAEGTVFYHLKSLKQRVECYLKQYLEEQKNIYYEIVNVENATLIGAAIAGLTN